MVGVTSGPCRLELAGRLADDEADGLLRRGEAVMVVGRL